MKRATDKTALYRGLTGVLESQLLIMDVKKSIVVMRTGNR